MFFCCIYLCCFIFCICDIFKQALHCTLYKSPLGVKCQSSVLSPQLQLWWAVPLCNCSTVHILSHMRCHWGGWWATLSHMRSNYGVGPFWFSLALPLGMTCQSSVLSYIKLIQVPLWCEKLHCLILHWFSLALPMGANLKRVIMKYDSNFPWWSEYLYFCWQVIKAIVWFFI